MECPYCPDTGLCGSCRYWRRQHDIFGVCIKHWPEKMLRTPLEPLLTSCNQECPDLTRLRIYESGRPWRVSLAFLNANPEMKAYVRKQAVAAKLRREERTCA